MNAEERIREQVRLEEELLSKRKRDSLLEEARMIIEKKGGYIRPKRNADITEALLFGAKTGAESMLQGSFGAPWEHFGSKETSDFLKARRQVREFDFNEVKSQHPLTSEIGRALGEGAVFAAELAPAVRLGRAALSAPALAGQLSTGAAVADAILGGNAFGKVGIDLSPKFMNKLSQAIGQGATLGFAEGFLADRKEGESRLSNAAASSLGGGAGGGLVAGISQPFNWIYEAAKPYASAFLLKESGDIIGNISTDVFNAISKNEKLMREAEKSAWNEANKYAKKADELGMKFDNKDYKSKLDKEIGRLGQQSKDNPLRKPENDNAIKYLSSLKDLPMNNWEEAIKAKKEINKAYRLEQGGEITTPFKAVNYAASVFEKQVANNFSNEKIYSLRDKWKEANSLTTGINETFYQIQKDFSSEPTQSAYAELKASGIGSPNKNKEGYTEVNKFIQDYIPKSSKEGTNLMRQFGAMVGNKDAAQDMMRAWTFESSKTDGNIDYHKLFKDYESLSPEQRSYLFKKSDIESLNSAKEMYKKNPKAFKQGFTHIDEKLLNQASQVRAWQGLKDILASSASSLLEYKPFSEDAYKYMTGYQNPSYFSQSSKQGIPIVTGSLFTNPESGYMDKQTQDLYQSLINKLGI